MEERKQKFWLKETKVKHKETLQETNEKVKHENMKIKTD